MPNFEFHLQQDTLQTRAYALTASDTPLRFHAGFTRADADDGWTQVAAEHCSASEVDTKLAQVVAFHKDYWVTLESECRDTRVVVNGEHYVLHALGTGPGFGGRNFRVHWMEKGRDPLLCNLSAQGRIPQWMRTTIPDNATAVVQER